MNIQNLNLSFGTEIIFNNVNIIIPENEKIGVVGVNGAGKTTLFKIIMGIEEVNEGHIKIKNNYRTGWLPQIINDEVPNTEIKVLDFIKEGRPIDKLNNKLQKLYNSLGNPHTNQEDTFRKIDNINMKLDYWEAEKSEATIQKITHGLKIDKETLNKKINELSGGQKSKIAFAKLLYSKPEIILLDEPTNHMDKDSKNYITEFLKNYKGTVLIISHDVEFLNEVTTKTLFVDKRTKDIKLFDGNYSKFLKIETAYEENLKNQAKIQNKEEKKLKAIINKYATSSGKRKKMAMDREKKLEKLQKQKIEVLETNKKIDLKMSMNRNSNYLPIQIENLCFKYHQKDNNLIDNLSLNIYQGEKFLIVGENGVGKSTLLKLIIGNLKPNTGIIKIGSKSDIGYYAQEQETLDLNKTIIENFDDLNLSETKIRSVLGNFLFYNDDVFKKVKVLSPGERARVALAKLSISGNNILLLDEPTNHLDPETQNVIGEVFKTFKGTMIVVSHNPEFVKHLGIERTLTLPEGKIDYYSENTVNYYHKLNTKHSH